MKKIYILIGLGLCLIFSAVYWYKALNLSFFTQNNEQKPAENQKEVNYTEQWIIVDIKGEVLRPKVYSVPREWVMYNLLELAGSMSTSDLTNINLALQLEHGQSYYIPKIDNTTTNSNNGSETNLVSINKAGIDELMSLPGIGEILAQRIIDYRKKTLFVKIEDIKNVTGIGDAIFSKIKDLITV